MGTVTLLTIGYFFIGAIIGSFLGVCAYRIPMGKYEPSREGIRELDHPVSLIQPARSFCPQCEKQLLWWHMIPLVSWILLRGRCAYCSKKIPARYLLIEVWSGAMAALCFLRFGANPTAIVAFGFIALLIVITYIDIDYMIIPDVITYPATAAGLLIGFVNRFLGGAFNPVLHYPFVLNPLESLLGLVAGPGVLMAVWWFYLKVRKREGLGLGDVKLLAFLGTAFGPECVCFTMFVGSLAGAIVGVAILLARRKALSSYIPFGPYLAIAAIAYILNILDLITLYVDPSHTSSWWVLRG